MTKCLKCGRELGTPDRAASISGSIMGDEYIETLYFCPDCRVYSIEVYHDRFMGEDEIHFRGPVPLEQGRAGAELIRRCPRPWDKKCRCPAHLEYFDHRLD